MAASKAASSGLPGKAGREIELGTGGGFVRWRYVGDAAWQNLVAVSALTGSAGNDGKSVELQKTATAIQWRQTGGSWADLVLLSALKGETGANGATLVGSVTISENALIALTAGIREVTVALAGTVRGARYLAFCDSYRIPSNAAQATLGRPAGYAILDCACNTAGQITVSLNAPLIVVGSSYSLTCSIVRITV